MRHICTRCKLTSPDGNLWCQEVDCPAGTLPLLLKYGDQLGKIKIVDLLRVLKAATLYRCEIEGKNYIIKVANPGPGNVEYLKREADNLKKIQLSSYKHPSLPVWVPHGAVNDQDAFGVTTFASHTLYYFLIEDIQGEFLFDFLIDNPQPFHEHVGWFILSLTEGIARIHQACGRLHLNLIPDSVLVVRNNTGVIQPVLVDMGLLLELGARQLPADMIKYQAFLQPAYTPHTLVLGGTPAPTDDVYGIGLLLYEMLAGHPAHQFNLRTTEDIFDDIRNQVKIAEIKRVDLPRRSRGGQKEVTSLIEISQKCLLSYSSMGYKAPADLRQDLLNLYGQIEEKREFRPAQLVQRSSRYAVGLSMLGLVGFVIVMLFIALFSPG